MMDNYIERMPDEQFWAIIADARSAGESEAEVYQRAYDLLWELPPDEILAFKVAMQYYACWAARTDLRGALQVIIGASGDDWWVAFLAWLIFQGREYYEAVVRDVNTLLSLERGAEPIWFDVYMVAMEVYEAKTEEDIVAVWDARVRRDQFPHFPRDCVAHEELPRRYPKLWAKFEGPEPGHGQA